MLNIINGKQNKYETEINTGCIKEMELASENSNYVKIKSYNEKF